MAEEVKVEAVAQTEEKPVVRRKSNARNDRRNAPTARRREESPYEESVVKVKRICKTVKGGRRMRFSALVVCGDKKGLYGFGTGKSIEVPEAIKKASEKAKTDMLKLNLVAGDTIAHTVTGHFGATKVFLKPAKEGTGIIAGGAVRTVLELAGVRNIYSKIIGSRTPINAIKATIDGLNQLKSKKNEKK